MSTLILEISALKGKFKTTWNLVGLLTLALGALPFPAAAADLIVLCPRAVETAVNRIADDFRAGGGPGIQFVLGTAGAPTSSSAPPRALRVSSAAALS